MIYDFNATVCPDPAPSDVCVIGAGAAGILLATQLVSAGLRVTLLEGGGRILEGRSQELYRSEVVGLPHSGVTEGRFRVLGGSTTEWGGQILELDEADFCSRPWVAGSGWPFPKSTLESYYSRALSFEGLRRVELDDRAVWEALGKRPPELSPELSVAFSRWCPERNFASLHREALASSRKLAVFCHANAIEFLLNEAKTVIASVKIRSFSDRTACVAARYFVLCMGGIETTRFLLQPAAQGVFPWHVNGVLGKHYQDHISCNGISLASLSLQPAERWFGYVSSRGFTYHNKIRLSFEEQKARRTLSVAGTIGRFGMPKEGKARAFRMLRRLRDSGEKLSAVKVFQIARHFPFLAYENLNHRLRREPPPWKEVMLSVHSEQCPLSASCVSLSSQRDEFGMLRTQLDWRISAEEIYTIRTFVQICESVFRRYAIAQVAVPAGFYQDDAVVLGMCVDSFHHMGSTRMSADGRLGIVDSDLRLYGVSNGYVCSSSVFPSSGFSNPTHTLLALGMRLVDRLSQQSDTQRLITSVAGGPGESCASGSNMRTVKLPGSAGRWTTQLGFGCSYFFGPRIDASKARRLLDAAWDAGIRHFDVAPLYGYGRSEALVGEFLVGHPDATVTTKYGLFSPNVVWRAALALQRRIPGTTARGAKPIKGRFKGKEASASLEHSLRLMRRDFVDLLLLHEPEVDDLAHDDLLEFLQTAKTGCKIADFGIGGDFHRIPDLYANRRRYCRVLQFEWSILSRAVIPDAYRIHYQVFAKAATVLANGFDRDPGQARQWSDATGADLNEPAVLSALLLRAALDAWPDSPVLFSTASEARIFDNVRLAENSALRHPAARLSALLHDENVIVAASLKNSQL